MLHFRSSARSSDIKLGRTRPTKMSPLGAAGGEGIIKILLRGRSVLLLSDFVNDPLLGEISF